MRHTARGPIAETYYQLQSLEHIDAAYARLTEHYESIARSQWIALQCAELAFFNLSDLLARSSLIFEEVLKNQGQAAGPRIAFHSDWHRESMRLIEKIAYAHEELARGPAAVSETQSIEGAGLGLYLSARERYDNLVSEIFQLSDLPEEAISSPSNQLISVRRVHDLKTSNLFLFRSLKMYANFPEDWRNIISCDLLRAAVYDAEIKLDADTYISQFRLLHQIPELIGRHNVNLLDEAISRITEHDYFKSIECVNHVVILNDLIIECIFPLLLLLTPGQYHRIRENLGETSGSHSDILIRSNGLFRGRAKQLAEVVNQINLDPDDHLYSLLRESCNKLLRQCVRWRDLHKGFPRNVLGNNATASLSGSRDAIRAVESMQSTFVASNEEALRQRNSEPVVTRQCSGLAPYPSWIDQCLNSILNHDNQLLSVTANVTQRRFDYVQRRVQIRNDIL